MVASGSHKKIRQKEDGTVEVQRTELELTLGRAVLALLETMKTKIGEVKLTFPAFEQLGVRYYNFGVSSDFGRVGYV